MTTPAAILSTMTSKKWWVAGEIAAELHGSYFSPQQRAAVAKALDALASEGKVFAAADGSFRLVT